jgi:hypothetical protein
MTHSQYAFLMAAWLLMSTILVGLWRTGRGRLITTWTVSIAAAFVGNTVQEFYPAPAREFYAWLTRQVVYVGLDTLVLVELARRLTAGAERSAAFGRNILALVAINLGFAALWPTQFPLDHWEHCIIIMIRWDVILAAGFAALGLLALWHCRPVSPIEKAVLGGLPVLRLLHALALWVWVAPGLAMLGDLFPAAEIVVFAWWAWQSWSRPGWQALRLRAVTP